jgi:tubulysin polyketide synthase-like protein
MNPSTSAVQIITRFQSAGIRVAAVGNRLRLVPKSRVTPEIIELARQYKSELLAYLAREPSTQTLETVETALAALRHTLVRIETMSSTCQRGTLERMGGLICGFGEILGRFFLRGNYNSVCAACLDFERNAVALVKGEHYF